MYEPAINILKKDLKKKLRWIDNQQIYIDNAEEDLRKTKEGLAEMIDQADVLSAAINVLENYNFIKTSFLNGVLFFTHLLMKKSQ